MAGVSFVAMLVGLYLKQVEKVSLQRRYINKNSNYITMENN
jgi:hypothetical protein